MNDLVVAPQRALTAADVRAHVNLVQEVMRAVMKSNTHYGVIPGCKQPSLYKAGSEVLLSTFRIAVSLRVEDLSRDGEIRYRVYAMGTHQTSGIVMGEGVGECSSGEEKYKWRNAICPEEFEDTPENMRRIKYSKWQGKVEKKQQVRTNPADVANTILKMAKKRAQIDLTLTTTAASDIFTQDIEDLPEELRDDDAPPATDPALAAKWIAAANDATSVAELTKIWTAGVKEIQAAKDMPSYAAFKNVVEAKGASLKAAKAAIEAEQGEANE